MILIINKNNKVIRAIHTNKALSDDDVKALYFCSEIDFSEAKIVRDVDANIGIPTMRQQVTLSHKQ